VNIGHFPQLMPQLLGNEAPSPRLRLANHQHDRRGNKATPAKCVGENRAIRRAHHTDIPTLPRQCSRTRDVVGLHWLYAVRLSSSPRPHDADAMYGGIRVCERNRNPSPSASCKLLTYSCSQGSPANWQSEEAFDYAVIGHIPRRKTVSICRLGSMQNTSWTFSPARAKTERRRGPSV